MNIKGPFFCLVVAFFCMNMLEAQVVRLTNEELNQAEADNLNLFLAQHPNVKIDQQLMILAQHEADRIAQINRLEPAPSNLVNGNFVGASFRIVGFNNQTGADVFTVVCYNNFLTGSSNYQVFSTFDPSCGNIKIQPSLFTNVGYGKAVSSTGESWVVRLIKTSQLAS